MRTVLGDCGRAVRAHSPAHALAHAIWHMHMHMHMQMHMPHVHVNTSCHVMCGERKVAFVTSPPAIRGANTLSSEAPAGLSSTSQATPGWRAPGQ